MCTKTITRYHLYKGDEYSTPLELPCGRCYECKRKKLNDWAFRLEQEWKASISGFFVTLTYRDEELVWGDGTPTLCKRDVQLYLKRVRKREPNSPIRYYACGEYGSLFGRPHYHLLVFNVVDMKILEDSWTLGFTHVAPIIGGATGYCVKYMSKEMTQDDKEGRRQKNFNLQSLGIGKQYLTPEVIAFHQASYNHSYCVNKAGYKISLPRYYKTKIFTQFQQYMLGSFMYHKANIVQKRELEEQQRKNKHLNLMAVQHLIQQRRQMKRFELVHEIF